ncbi:MAG: ABC transporter permease [Candidatus Gastranaerophilales bacterium]|nr:ABC transporter permease [Candidatus Gastranaerophilales bacterium]
MIDIFTIIKIALKALWVNKMRSALTSLGVIIGVSAVIIMIAVGTGASQRINEQISSMGSNLIMVTPGATTSGGVRSHGASPTLTGGDAEAVKEKCRSIKNAAPILNGVAQIVYGNQNWSTSVTGTTLDMLDIRDWAINYGNMFSENDIKGVTKVCVLGQTVAENLFGDVDPINKSIRIKGIPFKVLGVLTEKGQSARGDDQDDVVIIPYTTAQKKVFGTPFPDMIEIIMVQTKDVKTLELAQIEITSLLRQRHRIGLKQDDDFSVRNLTQMMQAAQQSSATMTFLLGAIASVSLLVGGIGIMNIMLVSVTERTREIGIRMAIGAKKNDIRFQFLVEALIISLMGGIIGVVIGLVGSYLVNILSSLPTKVSLASIILSFGFSGLIGIFFGFYPAYKASLLNPIEALRYE